MGSDGACCTWLAALYVVALIAWLPPPRAEQRRHRGWGWGVRALLLVLCRLVLLSFLPTPKLSARSCCPNCLQECSASRSGMALMRRACCPCMASWRCCALWR